METIIMKYKRLMNLLRVAILLLIPIVLMLLSADYFDNGHSICLSKSLANMECYACGMTRSIMHLIHGEILAGWHFNKLGILVLPLLVLFWMNLLLEQFGTKVFQWF